MGVFDTVLSTAPSGIDLSISTHIGRVAHAIAVNEHRALFPLESVESSYADRGFGSNTIEMGFIGAHSDIGGGYTVSDGGDLSNVALNWMWNQMVAAGVPMKPLEAHLTQVRNPILHDESGVGLWSVPGFGGWSSDRDVRYPDGALPQREAEPAEGMTWDQSQSFITYHPPIVVEDPLLGVPIETPCCGNNVGTVDMVKYREWLTRHGIIINE